nr:MAG TPA: hypothetical protein [Caudoviricetes sp.]
MGMNVKKFYETIAEIIAAREGVQIKVTVTEREPEPEPEEPEPEKHPAA